MLYLVVEKGANTGLSLAFDEEAYYTLGRAPENNLVLNDDMVSREHCRLRVKAGRIYIQDLESHNGTLVNYRNLTKVVELREDDLLQIGETEMIVSNKEIDPLIGREIHDYIFKERLGRGGGGTVYLAKQTNLDRDVAIKVLDPRLALEQKYRDNFVKEARRAANLNHHRLIGVFDIVEEEDLVFFSMEYMNEGSLGEIAKKEKKLDIDMVFEYMKQATEGLMYLHEGNLLHRDIKPDNLMLDKEFSLKLGDFGTAIEGTATNEGNIMGSPSFMSPEQIQGKVCDGRSDLYSLGCTAFRLLSGMPPFFGKTVKEILQAHIKEPAPTFETSVPELPAQLAEVYNKLLCKNPEDRFGSAAEFLEVLNSVSLKPAKKSTKKKKRTKTSTRSSSAGSKRGKTSLNRIIRKKRPKD